MYHKTHTPKADEIERRWYIVDAEDKVLGRIATEIARVVRGKHKPHFTPHLDTGDFVIVINAEKVRLTGNKLEGKMYYKHSGYTGSLKATPAGKMLEKHPERVIMHAVRGMLPKNRLGRKLLTKVKVYKGSKHPHEAQKPEVLNIDA